MKVLTSHRRSGFMMMEVILSLFIFTIITTSYTKALSALWRGTSFVKEELTITQILDSTLREALYTARLEEGSTEIFVPERDVTIEIQVIELELENEEGRVLPQMWEVKVIGRFQQNDENQERTVRGWRYLPLYRP